MNRELELNQKTSSASIDVEEQNEDIDPSFQTNPMYAGLHIKRDDRRTSEKFRDHDLPSIDSLGDVSENSTQDNSVELSDTEPGQLQLLSPETQSITRNETSQRRVSGLLNLLRNLGSPLSQTSRPESAQESRPNPFSYFSSIFGAGRPQPPLSLPSTDNIQPTNSEEPVNEAPTQEQTVATQPEDLFGRFPHGAIIVRTVQPGPNGSVVIRMRVISMDELFGRRGGSEAGSEGPNLGVFSLLLGMLSGMSTMEERGLEKETLDSLPVVTYTTEGFKNVDPESKRCTICFDDYEDGQDIRYLWCLHRFHKNCVDQWLDKHTNCPICKKDFSEAEKSFE